MKMLPVLLSSLVLTIFASAGLAQQPAPDAPSPIKITAIEVQRAKLPNAKSDWTKVICRISNSGGWVDGLSFNFSVLVQLTGSGADKFRVLSGGCTYMNVPKGNSEAIMYLSPNATLRFGTPVAVNVEVFRGDRPLEDFRWKSNSSSVDPNWLTKYSTYQGILLNMPSTPWIFSDIERTGDLIVN